MGIFARGKHRGRKASNYSGGAPVYSGKHRGESEDTSYAHDNKLCGCTLCPKGHEGNTHCKEHGNGCHLSC